MVVNQGDIFWIELPGTKGAEPGYRHPHVVVQNNLFNHSRINTTVVCTLTSNLTRAETPGNVFLDSSETNLPRHGVVLVSQIYTVNKTELSEYVGTISARRVRDVLNGISLVLQPRESE